jgi:hypothetical protein
LLLVGNVLGAQFGAPLVVIAWSCLLPVVIFALAPSVQEATQTACTLHRDALEQHVIHVCSINGVICNQRVLKILMEVAVTWRQYGFDVALVMVTQVMVVWCKWVVDLAMAFNAYHCLDAVLLSLM